MHRSLSSERPAGARAARAPGDLSRFDDETRRLLEQAKALLGTAPASEPARRVARSVESAGYTAAEDTAARKALRELNASREARFEAAVAARDGEEHSHEELVFAEQAVTSALKNHAMRGVRRGQTKKAARGHRVRWPERMRPRRAAGYHRDLALLTEADAAAFARSARNFAPRDLANPGQRARFRDTGPIAGYSRVAIAVARAEKERKRRAQPYRPESVPRQKASRTRDDACPVCNVVFSLAGWCECERTEPVPAPPAVKEIRVRKTRARRAAPGFDDETAALLAQARALLGR